MAKAGVLVDVGRCIGCHACTAACKVKNDTPDNVSWTKIKTVETGRFPDTREYNAPLGRCMHCEHPACASACPVGALQKTESGPVTYDPDRCIGCRYCMTACPFGVPKLNWGALLPSIQKCQLCDDRLAAGLEPACTSVCPTGALQFGERNALLAEARQRTQSGGGQYVNHIYGENEIGGTAVLYISPVSFEVLGFPALGTDPVTPLSEQVLIYGTPAVAVVGLLALGGLSWFTRRKEQLQQAGASGSARIEEE